VTSAAKRLLKESLGWVLLAAGLLALFLPGPGLLLTFAGLAVLSTQYLWARRLTEPVRVKAWLAAVEGVENWLRITISALGALLMAALGALWVWSPPAPGWWMLDERWWLFGGPALGWSFIGSSAIALALLVFSVLRFHGHPAAVAEVVQMQTRHKLRVARRRRAHQRLNRRAGRPDRFWHGHL
jgi:hypothetical protein